MSDMIAAINTPASRLKSGQSTAPCCLYVGESKRKVGSVKGTESESRYKISLNDDLASTSPFCARDTVVKIPMAERLNARDREV